MSSYERCPMPGIQTLQLVSSAPATSLVEVALSGPIHEYGRAVASGMKW